MTEYPRLQKANQYRSIRAKCLPLFDVAAGENPGHQVSIYRTMVMIIADTLDVETRWQDMVVELPDADVHIIPNTTIFQAALDRATKPLVTYDPAIWGFSVSPTYARTMSESEWLGNTRATA